MTNTTTKKTTTGSLPNNLVAIDRLAFIKIQNVLTYFMVSEPGRMVEFLLRMWGNHMLCQRIMKPRDTEYYNENVGDYDALKNIIEILNHLRETADLILMSEMAEE